MMKSLFQFERRCFVSVYSPGSLYPTRHEPDCMEGQWGGVTWIERYGRMALHVGGWGLIVGRDWAIGLHRWAYHWHPLGGWCWGWIQEHYKNGVREGPPLE